MIKITGTEMDKIAKTRPVTLDEYFAFRTYLRAEHGTSDLPSDVEDNLYDDAYAEGHSAGYAEVDYVYGDLATEIL